MSSTSQPQPHIFKLQTYHFLSVWCYLEWNLCLSDNTGFTGCHVPTHRFILQSTVSYLLDVWCSLKQIENSKSGVSEWNLHSSEAETNTGCIVCRLPLISAPDVHPVSVCLVPVGALLCPLNIKSCENYNTSTVVSTKPTQESRNVFLYPFWLGCLGRKACTTQKVHFSFKQIRSCSLFAHYPILDIGAIDAASTANSCTINHIWSKCQRLSTRPGRKKSVYKL